MFEKVTNAWKKIILLRSRWLAMGLALVLLVSSLAFPVSAAGEFINYDDYATYSASSTDGYWNVSATFPRDWFGTRFWTADWGSQIGYFEEKPTFSVTIPEGAQTWCMQVSPLGGMLGGWVGVGSQLGANTHILDLSLIPDNTAFLYRFTMDYGGDVSLQAAGSCEFCIACVNSSGEVLSVYSKEPIITQDGYTVSYSGSLTPGDYDDSAAGLVPYFYLKNQGVVWPTDSDRTIQVSMDFFRLSFTITDAIKQAQEDARSQKMLSNIETALAEQGKTMEEVLEQQQQTNEKLDELPGEIGDEVQGIIDSEKEQSKNDGNEFVDQILDALPDPSQDVLAALGALTDSMAYTGTDAVLPIPAIVLPGIDGLFPETEIWGGTEFSFADYLGFLPPTLLTLVQSLFTIAIVLFCAYEIKGIVSYCLTLRESKGG